MDLIQFIVDQKVPVGINKSGFLNEAWEKIDSVIVEDRISFFENYEMAKQQVSILENKFIKKQQTYKSEDDKCFQLTSIYSALQFFPTTAIIEKFNTIGFKKSELKFFIDIKQIIQEIDNINQSPNVRIKYESTIKLLKIHFTYKITDLVQKHFDLVGNKKSGAIYNEAHNSLFDFFRNFSNFQKYNTKFLENDKNKLFLEILNQANAVESSDAVFRKNILDNTQGKTEKSILKEIIDFCVYYKCSEGELYRTIFGFYKIIMPDSSLLTYDEFYASDQSVAYDGNYSRYQYLKLKSILKTSVK